MDLSPILAYLAETDPKRKARALQEIVRGAEGYVRRFLYRSRRPTIGHEPEDLYQAALFGFANAVRDWKPELGPFQVLATIRMRVELKSLLGEDRIQYWQDGTAKEVGNKIRNLARVIYAKTGRNATAEELGIPQQAHDRMFHGRKEVHLEDLPPHEGATWEELVPGQSLPVDEEADRNRELGRVRNVKGSRILGLVAAGFTWHEIRKATGAPSVAACRKAHEEALKRAGRNGS